MTEEEKRKFKEIGASLEVTWVEKIVVVGPMNRADELRALLNEDDFHVTESGPYTDREFFPRCDVTRYKYHAERELMNEPWGVP